jgi:hypothetical protein
MAVVQLLFDRRPGHGNGRPETGSVAPAARSQRLFSARTWASPGPRSSGITAGPLSAPSNSAAIALEDFGNSCYFTGGSSPTYPNAYDTDDGGENQ